MSIETGVLWRDDNAERLADPDAFPSESVDLVYLDPPFFSNRVYEVIWGDEAEVRSFEDRWEGGMRHYIGWMRDRIQEMHRSLRISGTLYVHCDPHASHYLKVMLDDVFGTANFLSEVSWRRTGTHSSANRWAPVHDTLLMYAKRAGKHTWNRPYEPLSELHKQRHYRHTNEQGRLFAHGELTAPGTRRGRSGMMWRGFDVTSLGRHWSTTIDRLDELAEEGLIYFPPDGGWPRRVRFEEDSRGRAIGDVWTDIPPINMKARERLGYPTQKPEALLERIITSSSNENDVILDPFCGCGTTITVAERLSRRWVGIDISPTAIEIMRRRLWRQHRRAPDIRNNPDSVDELRRLKPFEFQNWIVNAIGGYHSTRHSGDMGIDGYTFFRREPIQVKQSEAVGRNVVDNFETAIRRDGQDTGHIIAFSFTKGAYNEARRAREEDGLSISLTKVNEVLLLVRRPQSRTAVRLGISEELPITPRRDRKDMRTAEELIDSDRRAG